MSVLPSLRPAFLLPLLCLSAVFAGLFQGAGIARAQSASNLPAPTSEEYTWLGDRIFANECSRDRRCLTAWNTGEDFPSLGIGHFIWYRQDQDGIFEESFPALMRFMQAQGQDIPAWIETAGYNAPWPDRDSFLADMDSPRLTALRDLLAITMPLQTAFIVSRFDQALANMLSATADPVQRDMLENRFALVASSNIPYGLYALIDYVNFKGTGVSARETYNNTGWGLRQVLLGMADVQTSDQALAEFVRSAAHVLTTRVDNAPPARNESRWLAGWHNRLTTYLPDNLTGRALPTNAPAP